MPRYKPTVPWEPEAASRFLWGESSLKMAELNLDMGYLEHQLGHLQRALAHYETARDIRARAPGVGPEHELTSEVSFFYCFVPLHFMRILLTI